jgi:hypothetical protein
MREVSQSARRSRGDYFNHESIMIERILDLRHETFLDCASGLSADMRITNGIVTSGLFGISVSLLFWTGGSALARPHECEHGTTFQS